MSNKPNTPSLADLAKAQSEREQAEERRQAEVAERNRIEDNNRRAKWGRMLAYAEVAVAEINKELEGTGISVEIVKDPANGDSLSYGSLKATVMRQSGSRNEYIEFRSTSMGFIYVAKPRQPKTDENPDLGYDDADDALGREIRAYLTEVFSA